jgi:hypothetical protein
MLTFGVATVIADLAFDTVGMARERNRVNGQLDEALGQIGHEGLTPELEALGAMYLGVVSDLARIEAELQTVRGAAEAAYTAYPFVSPK